MTDRCNASLPSAKLSVALVLAENNFGFTLTLTDEDDNSVSVVLERGKELARTPQTDNLRTQLGKLGNTPFEPARIDIDFSENWFIPCFCHCRIAPFGSGEVAGSPSYQLSP